jgi:hypothetical protein
MNGSAENSLAEDKMPLKKGNEAFVIKSDYGGEN